MTDAWMIEVIAKRLDCECPFSKAASILNHQSWLDVVEHLWKDKRLRGALIEAYQPEILAARAQELLEVEERESRASAYAEWKADSSLRGSESDSLPL